MGKDRLHPDVLKKLNLDALVEVFSSKEGRFTTDSGTPVRLKFLGVDMLTVGYLAEEKRVDHYLLRNDPWLEREENPISIYMQCWIPKGATHYLLGPKKTEDRIRSENQGNSKDFIPIVFLKR